MSKVQVESGLLSELTCVVVVGKRVIATHPKEQTGNLTLWHFLTMLMGRIQLALLHYLDNTSHVGRRMPTY